MTKDTNKDNIVYVSSKFNANPRYQPQFDDPQKAIDYLASKENALKVIRYLQENVAGLKEPTFGCQFKYKGEIKKIDDFIYCNGFKFADFNNTDIIEVFPDYSNATFEKIIPEEIIGHEPQLNHLLLAILLRNYNGIVSKQNLLIQDSMGLEQFKSFYSLEKTVQENLKSNEELCNYLINLFEL